MSNVLLAVWMAFIGADRIDLVGGAGPFILTPFLALTPVVVLSEVARRLARGRPVAVPRFAIAYAITAGVLISAALASTFVSIEIGVSAARVFLLIGQISGTLVVALLASDRPDLLRVLARGAMLGVATYLVFDPAEALSWFGKIDEMIRVGPISIDIGHLQNVGPVPRLAGPVADGNRGGFVLLCYFVIIAKGEPRVALRRVALTITALAFAATVSRSAALGALATMSMALLLRGRLSVGVIAAALIATIVVTLALLLYSEPLGRLAEQLQTPVTERLTLSEGGSGREHLRLIERGLQEATKSVARTALGLGYGNSYLVLQDFFPGHRYGSYHSFYVSIFAETGIVGLLSLLALLAVPLIFGGSWRALVAGAIAFNVFYQTNTEPIFWFVLALAWLELERHSPPRSVRSRADVTPSPEPTWA